MDVKWKRNKDQSKHWTECGTFEIVRSSGRYGLRFYNLSVLIPHGMNGSKRFLSSKEAKEFVEDRALDEILKAFEIIHATAEIDGERLLLHKAALAEQRRVFRIVVGMRRLLLASEMCESSVGVFKFECSFSRYERARLIESIRLIEESKAMLDDYVDSLASNDTVGSVEKPDTGSIKHCWVRFDVRISADSLGPSFRVSIDDDDAVDLRVNINFGGSTGDMRISQVVKRIAQLNAVVTMVSCIENCHRVYGNHWEDEDHIKYWAECQAKIKENESKATPKGAEK